MFSILAISSGLLTINWGVFIWAVGAGRVVESALGYYITPLLNVLFGILIFRESLRVLQWLAVAFGAASVLILALEYHHFPWISLSLAFSWGTYSLVKKLIDLGALESLTIETLIAFLPSLAFLFYIEGNGTAQFGQGIMVTALTLPSWSCNSNSAITFQWCDSAITALHFRITPIHNSNYFFLTGCISIQRGYVIWKSCGVRLHLGSIAFSWNRSSKIKPDFH